MREMSSLDIMFLLNELKLLVGGRIQKIYQDGKKLRIEVYLPGKGTFEIYFEPGRIFISEFKRSFEEPGNFAMLLRKHLRNQRITNVKQKDFDRIVEIETDNYILIFEIFSKGNAILCYKDYKILMPMQVQKWRDRDVKPGIKYIYPPAVNNIFKLSLDEFRKLLNEKELVKFLATDLSLSGLYAEEVCLRAGIYKDRPANLLSDDEILKVYEVVMNLKDEFGPQMIVDDDKVIDAVPFDMKFYENKNIERTTTFTHALDEFYSKSEQIRDETEEREKIDKSIEKLQRIAEEQEKNIEKMESEEKRHRESAETIYNNLETVNQIISEMEEMKKRGMKWSEIKERMKNKVKEINEKKGKIILDL